MLAETSFSFQNILDSDGIGIAITGMSIVFIALALITSFIYALPKLLAKLEYVLPPEQTHHSAVPAPQADEAALAVAIGFALHTKAKNDP